jgi:hypothetical protein
MGVPAKAGALAGARDKRTKRREVIFINFQGSI